MWSSLISVALGLASFTLTRVYPSCLCTWALSRYLIKAPPLTFGAEVVLSLATLAWLLPLLLLAMGANLGVRALVALYLRLRHGSTLTLMSGRDSFVSHDEFANSCNHYSLYVIKGRCDISKIQRKFTKILEERLGGEVVYERMKRRLVQRFGYYCSQAAGDQFDIREHVRYLTGSQEAVLGEKEVFEEIEKLYDHPFPGDKPQWEILVIPHFKYDKEEEEEEEGGKASGRFTAEFEERVGGRQPHYGFIVRMHHSIMDGISAGNALQHYMADAPIRLTVDPLCPSHKLGWVAWALGYLQVAILGPRAFFKVLFLDETNCFHGEPLRGPKRLKWSRMVNVEALRKVKKSTRTSVTAVLISSLGGSVRNLALRRGLDVPGEVHAFPTIGILPFPDILPRNRFTMALLPLRIGLETPLERLKAAHSSLKTLLRSPDILTNYHLMQVFGVLPVRVINFFLEKCHATLLLSNVPGPAEKATIFGGDEIVDIGIWAPIHNKIGIGMSLFSYGGVVRATIVVDEVACPHPSDVDTLIQEFEREVGSLARLANVPLHEVFREGSVLPS